MFDVQDSTDCSYLTLPLFWQRRFPGQSIHWPAGGPAGLPCSSSARQPHLPVPQQPLSFPASPTCCLQPMHTLKCCRQFFSLPVSLARPETATVPASPDASCCQCTELLLLQNSQLANHNGESLQSSILLSTPTWFLQPMHSNANAAEHMQLAGHTCHSLLLSVFYPAVPTWVLQAVHSSVNTTELSLTGPSQLPELQQPLYVPASLMGFQLLCFPASPVTAAGIPSICLCCQQQGCPRRYAVPHGDKQGVQVIQTFSG